MEWLSDGLAYRMGRRPLLKLRTDWELVCHPAAFRALNTANVHDSVQAAELAEFVTRCSTPMIFLDIGAHYGVFSLAAVHYAGPGTRVVAIDPSHWATKMLRTQTELNSASDAVSIERAAVGASVGTMRMLEVGVISDGYMVTDGLTDHSQPSTANSQQSTVNKSGEASRPASEYTEVPMTTIDALCEQRQLTPTHIKIDVEGVELDVLRGGSETLRHAHPTLFIELHNAMVRNDGGDPASALATLERLGYAEWLVEGRRIERAEILADDLVRIVAV